MQSTQKTIKSAQEVSTIGGYRGQNTHLRNLADCWFFLVNRSGTEEECCQLNQLLEDIYTFRKDANEMQKNERESKKQKEKEDKRKAEEMRDAALIGWEVSFISNISYRILFVISKNHNRACNYEMFIKIVNV